MLDRVPCEIFSNIIKLSCRNFSVTTVFPNQDETSLVPPIKATHVCRSWRTALLSNPTMWTCIRLDIVGTNSDELKEMLSRSGSAPLDVFIEQAGYGLDRSQSVDLTNILPHVHRFRKLHMLIPTAYANAVFHLLRQPAPILQKLYLELRRLDERDWTTLGEAYQNLFLGNTTNLKHAHIQSACLKELQSVSLFKNLLTLRLHIDPDFDMVIDGDILLGILHSSPCLRILDIQLTLSKIVCSMPSNHRIPLPCLQKLSLRGRCGVNHVDFVLGRLDFPVDKVDFDIACHGWYPEISDSTLLFPFLAQRRLSLLSISSSVLEDMVTEFFEKVDMESPIFCPLSKESSVFRLLYNRAASFPTLYKLFLNFELLDITHMYLEIIASECAVLRNLLPLLENLQNLRVNHVGWDDHFLRRPFPRSYLEILMSWESVFDDSDSDYESDDEDLFPCPSLHTLELAFADPFEESYIQQLVECSEIREEGGHPFRSITICCRGSALVESAKAWLQTHDGGLRVEVTLWSTD